MSEARETVDVHALRERARVLEDEVVVAEKRLEAELERGVQHEALFRMLIESVRDYAIFMLDPHGRVATWNTGAERIKGYAAHEIIGRHFSQFYPEEVAKSGKCEYELEVAAREGRFEDEGWRVRKDGSEFWANVVISAVRNPEGELIGFSKVTRDLTERKRAEEERAALLAAEQSSRAKDEFLAMLGHELRNPLAPIVTALQLMKLRNDGKMSRETQVIERQVQHLMHLVDDLLDIARITRGKLDLKRRSTDIRGIIATSIEIASPLLEQRQHHLNVEVPPRELIVDGDPARLTQVIANLLTNAAKYTEVGGRIWVDAQQRAGEITIDVRDNGIGLAPTQLANIFDLFVQAQQGVDRAHGGLGIGLALVKRLTEMHGGTVEAKSDGPGRGSTFRVRLPAADEAATRNTREVAVQNVASRRKVLVVDDNDDACMLLAEALADLGHDVQSARDAPAALAVIKQFKPDVAVLDIGLPVMDGYQLGAKLREELGDDIRLFALTGYGQPNDRERSKKAGFAGHFVKPISVQALHEAIGES